MPMPMPRSTSLRLFTFCFYIGKNTYHELVRMLYVLIMSLDRFHPDFFLVVYHNLGITIDDPRVRMVRGFRPPTAGSVLDSRDRGGDWWGVKDDGGGVTGGDAERLLLDAGGCAGNVWVEGSAVRNRWHKLSFNKIHVFKNLYVEYGGVCFTWIDLDTIVLADLSYLNEVDNYFVIHGGGGGGGGERIHDVLVGGGVGGGEGGGGVLWAIPERMYIQGSFWKLNLALYNEVLRLDSLFRENGVKLKYDLQSIFAVMAWGGGVDGGCRCPFYDGVSRASSDGGGRMLVIGENFMPGVMNGLGVWDTKESVGNHVNTVSLAEMRWGGSVGGSVGGSAPPRRFRTNDSDFRTNDSDFRTNDSERGAVDIDRRLKSTAESGGGGGGGASDGGGGAAVSIFRTMMYPDKEIHILSLTFDSFFTSNVSETSDFARLFPFLVM